MVQGLPLLIGRRREKPPIGAPSIFYVKSNFPTYAGVIALFSISRENSRRSHALGVVRLIYARLFANRLVSGRLIIAPTLAAFKSLKCWRERPSAHFSSWA
jgi:hypothetical protein